jgi:hypothetical protein
VRPTASVVKRSSPIKSARSPDAATYVSMNAQGKADDADHNHVMPATNGDAAVMPADVQVVLQPTWVDGRTANGMIAVVNRRCATLLIQYMVESASGSPSWAEALLTAMSTSAISVADLEPSLVSGRTYVTRRRLIYIDAATMLGLMVVLLTLVPARLVVPGRPTWHGPA